MRGGGSLVEVRFIFCDKIGDIACHTFYVLFSHQREISSSYGLGVPKEAPFKVKPTVSLENPFPSWWRVRCIGTALIAPIQTYPRCAELLSSVTTNSVAQRCRAMGKDSIVSRKF